MPLQKQTKSAKTTKCLRWRNSPLPCVLMLGVRIEASSQATVPSQRGAEMGSFGSSRPLVGASKVTFYACARRYGQSDIYVISR